MMYIGWQDIPKTWGCRRGYFGVYISTTKKLKLVALSKIAAANSIQYWCFLCQKKSCHHTTEEFLETEEDVDYVKTFPFEYDNEDLEENGRSPVVQFQRISNRKYPCNLNLNVSKIFLSSNLRM